MSYHRAIGDWNSDAKQAMIASPDYFVWWYTAKSIALVGVTAMLAYTLGRMARR